MLSFWKQQSESVSNRYQYLCSGSTSKLDNSTEQLTPLGADIDGKQLPRISAVSYTGDEDQSKEIAVEVSSAYSAEQKEGRYNTLRNTVFLRTNFGSTLNRGTLHEIPVHSLIETLNVIPIFHSRDVTSSPRFHTETS